MIISFESVRTVLAYESIRFLRRQISAGRIAPAVAMARLLAAALVLGLVTTGGCRGAGAPARQLAVAAASDLKFSLDEIVRAYVAAHAGADVRVTYGSSGNFHAQLRNRAPFDLFLSADVGYPRDLESHGLTIPGSTFTYAFGRLALWVDARSGIDVERRGMEALRDPAVRHVAIANPAHAPYGRAAEAAMRSFGVYAEVQPKLVLGENVAQAVQFVESGAADAGLVAVALVRPPEMASRGRVWDVPSNSYPPLEQGGAILRWARDPREAQAFRAFLLADAARAILYRHGFGLPRSQ